MRRITVIGAGTMGHGIAHVACLAGYDTILQDARVPALESGLDRIRSSMQKGVSLGKLELESMEEGLQRLRGVADLAEAVERADLVVEAIPESMELKTGLLQAIEAAAPRDAILASNTSSLSIDALGSALESPERFLGLHFFNPVHIMALVEVVHGPRTSVVVREKGLEFARSLGKEPILVKDSPGFASSRLGVVLGLEAMRMLEEGVASASDIDRAMELGYRHPMGPLRLTDLVGLDVRLGIARYLHETLGAEHFRPPAILQRLVDEGRLGRKSGRGFYDWGETT
jgi:3-hydroxybutyryl-CoA dehydrogenase